MPNRPVAVKQIDVTRAVKGAVAAGLIVGRVEVDQRTGKIVIFSDGGQGANNGNEWDEILR